MPIEKGRLRRLEQREDIGRLVQRAGRPFPLPDDLIEVSFIRYWDTIHHP